MTSSAEALLQLVAAAGEHACPALFKREALALLQREVGCEGAVYLPFCGDGVAPAFVGASPAQFARYAQKSRDYRHDLAKGVALAHANQSVYTTRRVYTEDERRRLGFFTEILAPQEVSDLLTGLVQFRGKTIGAINLQRKGGGRFSEDEEARLAQVLPVLAPVQAGLDLAVVAQGLELRGLRDLTHAEKEVATRSARGLRNREIATELGISPYTVRNHLANVFHKLAVTSRAELAFELTRAGYPRGA